MSTISIAMTTYCGEKFIEKQLLSLLNQKRQADEVLIFDDRSKDNTAQIVTSFIEANGLSNWHFEVNSENKGFIKNFHHAIECCTGDIIFLCDQDDIWHNDKLEKLEKLFDENPDAQAINAGFQFIDGDDNLTSAYEKPGTANHNLIFRSIEKGKLEKISESEIIKGNISPGCTMAFTKKLKEAYMEKASLTIPHDLELNIYAAQMNGLYFYNEQLTSYRIHSNNAIGLDDSEDKVKVTFNSSRDARLRVLNDEVKYVEFLNNLYKTENPEVKAYIKSFTSFIEHRRSSLENCKISAWIKMWKYYKPLQPNLKSRQIACDLLFTLKIERFFKGV